MGENALHAFAGGAGEGQGAYARRFLQLVRQGVDQLLVERVALVERHHDLLLLEPRAIGFEFFGDDGVRLPDILVVGIHQVEQHASALDMAKEAVADTGAFGRAFDQAGNVRQHELAALVAHHAELRVKRGERVGPDLWHWRCSPRSERSIYRHWGGRRGRRRRAA
jgi:hypothetical protein